MIENIIGNMIELTEEKIESLNVILYHKPKQKEAIMEENMEGIGEVIDLIQTQINKIDQINSLYVLKVNELKTNSNIENILELDDVEYSNSRALKDNLSKITSLLQQIKTLDDENNLLMNEKFQETKEMLKNLRQGKKMAKGYLLDSSSNTIFLDERN
ncbi:MAG: flagellar export chaperone FlgN [Tissierellales bacterium]